MVTRMGTALAAAALMLAAAGCGGSTTQESADQAAAPAADASHDEHAGGATGVSRVFFVQPKDGDTVSGDFKIEFGSESFEIAAVPPGEVTSVRSGVGHYHLGLDTDCLPAGEIIPKADPWIHFGTGANTAEAPLKPGTHKLTVQAGDDQHRTIAGLCETITVMVQ